MSRGVLLCGMGTASAALLTALHAADMTVTLLEDDVPTVARVADILTRQAGGAEFAVATRDQPVRADVVIGAAGAMRSTAAARLYIVTDGPAQLALAPDPAHSVAMDILDPAFVEVAYGRASADTRRIAAAFLDRIAAAVMVAPDGSGSFAGTRLLDTALALTDRLLLAGTTPWELDAALEDVGFASGLLAEQDRIGLEVAFARRRAREAPLVIADRMVREGRLGRSVGVGWYRYPGGGGAVVDPLLEDMIVEEARFAGLPRAEMPPAAAARALLLGVINAAAKLGDYGVTATQADLLCVRKLGLEGVSHVTFDAPVADLLTALAPLDPALWTPAPALRRPDNRA